jgi:hypothetical protein
MTRSIAAIRRRRVLMLNSRRSPGIFALDAEALGELALLDQVAGRQEEIGVAIVDASKLVRSRSHSSSSKEAKT